MKKIILSIIVISLIIISSALWIFAEKSNNIFSYNALIQFIIILFLIIVGVFVIANRIKSKQVNEPSDDEMTKAIMQKAASVSYFVSLYIWVFVIYIKDRVKIDIEELIGYGILSMGVVFVLSFLIIKSKGLK